MSKRDVLVRRVDGVPRHTAVDDLAESYQLHGVFDDVRVVLRAPIRLGHSSAEVAVEHGVELLSLPREVAYAPCRDGRVCNVRVPGLREIVDCEIGVESDLSNGLAVRAVYFGCIFNIKDKVILCIICVFIDEDGQIDALRALQIEIGIFRSADFVRPDGALIGHHKSVLTTVSAKPRLSAGISRNRACNIKLIYLPRIRDHRARKAHAVG